MTSTNKCYCCLNLHKENEPSREQQEMDLDTALHELDMLSTVTESRKQYICEKLHSKENDSTFPSGSFLIHLDSRFVTKFSFSKPANLVEAECPSSCSSEDSLGTNFNVELGDPTCSIVSSWSSCRASKMKTRRSNRHSICKPYDFPWKMGKVISVLSVPNCEKSVEVTPPASNISRQDSGNKSNPGSPVKNHELNSIAGCSIFRSRSLDNLDNATFELTQPESCHSVMGRIDVDTVSQRISNLHVS